MRLKTVDECKCEPVTYIYGGVTISPKPPPPFNLAIKVEVGAITAAVGEPQHGDRHIMWNYLALVKPGLVRVRCTVGDVTVVRSLEARAGTTEIMNFCFGDPVHIGPETKMKGPRFNSEQKQKSRSNLDHKKRIS